MIGINFKQFLSIILCLTVNCAINDHRSKRVVNDQYATPHSRPWMVMLTRDGKYICGAALVNRPPNHHQADSTGSSDILLTAAHCLVQHGENEDFIFTDDYRRFSALFGKHNSTGYEDAQIEVKFANIMVHQMFGYDEIGLLNDIAMVKLERPVNHSETIKPIALSRFLLEEMTNCSIAGWGRHIDIPANDDPNTVLSILDLPNLHAMDQRYEMKIRSWNESIIPGDSGSPMTCWKDGHFFLQGVTSYGHATEELTNFGQHKINVTVLEDVRFMNVISFLATNWIVEAFENIDVPNIWLNRLSEYWPNSANSVHEEYLQTTEEVLNNFYFGLPEGYNRELTLPQYSSTDYVQLWVEKRIYDHIYDVEHMAADIQDLIGYIKQSDPYKCAIDCFMWNGNRPCFFMFDNRRCFFSAKKYANRLGDFGLSMLRIRMKGEHEAEPGLIKDFNFKTVEKKSAIPKHWNVSISMEGHEDYHCLGVLTSIDRKTYGNVNVSKNCFFGLRKAWNSHKAIVTSIINGTIYLSTLNISNSQLMDDSGVIQLVLQYPIPTPNVDTAEFGHIGIISDAPSPRRYNPYSGSYLIEPGTRPLMVHIEGSNRRNGKNCYGVLINESTFSAIEGHVNDTSYVLTTNSCVQMHDRGPASVSIGYYSMESISRYFEQVYVKTVHLHPNDDQALKDVALIELEQEIQFTNYIKPVAFKDPEFILQNEALLSLSYDSACNHHPEKLLSERPMKIDSQSDSINATDIFAQRQFYVQNNHSCHGQIGYHGEPLFAYNSISNEYHLLGLSSGAVKQDVKFIDNFKSVWHYLPWISETVRNSVAQREELNRIWMAEENKDMEYGWLWKYLKKNL